MIPKGFRVPRWPDIWKMSEVVSKLSGMGFIGIDLVLDQENKILVLEINGYPGLEIQNVSHESMLMHW